MFERFADDAKRVMRRAEHEAATRGNSSVDTEHLLLGIMKEGAVLLPRLEIDRRGVYVELERLIRISAIPSPQLPLAPGARKAIEYAKDEAESLKHPFFFGEHLLLGLLREGEGIAAQVLMKLGITLDGIRDQLAETLQGMRPGAEEATPAPQHASKTLIRARNSAQRHQRHAATGDTVVNTGHMLLSFLNDSESIAAKALARLRVDKGQLRNQLAELLEIDREE